MAKSAKNVVTTTTLNLSVKVIRMKAIPKRDQSKHRSKKGKGKRFQEVNEDSEGVMDDLTEQVQSLFYNDVRFNAINTRMHTVIKCETPDGRFSENRFKIDTWADGNLMRISMFSKLIQPSELRCFEKEQLTET